MCPAEAPADHGGKEGWIDTTAGRSCINYDDDDDDDAESSTYFPNQAARGQKRKKAPFFKYSKKKKGYNNTSYNSKGSVYRNVYLSFQETDKKCTFTMHTLFHHVIINTCFTLAALIVSLQFG